MMKTHWLERLVVFSCGFHMSYSGKKVEKLKRALCLKSFSQAVSACNSVEVLDLSPSLRFSCPLPASNKLGPKSATHSTTRKPPVPSALRAGPLLQCKTPKLQKNEEHQLKPQKKRKETDVKPLKKQQKRNKNSLTKSFSPNGSRSST